jgi:hypothetical protein
MLRRNTARCERAWLVACRGHRFVKELFAGAVPDAVMARYLIQDHRFLDSFLTRGAGQSDTAYRHGSWEEARAGFERCLAITPGDAPSKVFLGGLALLRTAAPSTDWTGV